MTYFVGAVALIRREHEAQLWWLVQWNYESQRFHFVGGPKEGEESFRDCLDRQVSQGFDLRVGKDYIVSRGPRAHLQFTAISESTEEETQYVLELFDVQLFGKEAPEKIGSDSRNRWVTEEEILSGKTRDGEPISRLMTQLLSQADLFSEWY